MKVVGSIPVEITEFLNCPNPSRRTMALGSTHLSGIFLGVKDCRPTHRADKLTDICELSRNVGGSTSHNPMRLQGLLQAEFTLFVFCGRLMSLKIRAPRIGGSSHRPINTKLRLSW
jgi:hypothetical protein